MKRLLLFLAIGSPVGLTQWINPIIIVASDPSGACPARRIQLSIASGNLFFCRPDTNVWSVGVTAGGFVSPTLYGGSATGSILELDGTSNGSPSSAFLKLQTNGQNTLMGCTGSPVDLFELRNSTGCAAPPTQYATGQNMEISGLNATNNILTMTAYAQNSLLALRRFDGTVASVSAVQSAENLGAIDYVGYDGTVAGGSLGARFSGKTTQIWTSTNHGSQINVFTIPNNSTTATLACVFDQDQSITCPLFKTTTNCQNTASPAVCGSASAGMSTIAAAATSKVVNTTAITANSEIIITEDESLGAALSVTCNTQSSLVVGTLKVSARTAATSFTVITDVAPTTNPICFSYRITN